MNINNKVALITGSAKRIGKAIAIALAKKGANIVVHYQTSKKEASNTVAELKELGVEAISVAGDISDYSDVKRCVRKAIRKFKRIDILVNNASVFEGTPFDRLTENQWNRIMDVNLKGTFLFSKEISKIMKKQKTGKIINIADIAGIQIWKNYIPYSVSKAGVIVLTKGFAKALSPFNIQVNALAPGVILPSKNFKGKQIGSPTDIANTVIFLIEGSDFITGTTIVIDGGKLLCTE